MSNVQHFGAVGDGAADDTDALQHAIDVGDGHLELPRGDYRLTRPLRVDLARCSRTGIHGSGGTARLVMDGPGAAIQIIGTHSTTAEPAGFRPEEWQHERMPIVTQLEIIGSHDEADGIRIEGAVQPTLTNLLIREVRTAVHITGRARNVLISHCHIYHNTGVGIHLDELNLHQTIITGSHISYCRLGGIRIDNSEIRNLQITGNDIEYNNNRSFPQFADQPEPTAEIYVNTLDGSVREGTISSNTIQAKVSPGGSNIRFIGRSKTENLKAGMWTISGNLIGSQENNVHLSSVRGITLTGNYIYSGQNRNLLVENSRNIVLAGNIFGHNPDYGRKELCTGVRFENTVDCNLSGNIIQDCAAGRHTVSGVNEQTRQALLELQECSSVNLNGNQIVDGSPVGIHLKNCNETLITGCTVRDSREQPQLKHAIVWEGSGQDSQIANCILTRCQETPLRVPSEVLQANNVARQA